MLIWWTFFQFVSAEWGLGRNSWLHRTCPKQLFPCYLCCVRITLSSAEMKANPNMRTFFLRWPCEGLWWRVNVTVGLGSSSLGVYLPSPHPEPGQHRGGLKLQEETAPSRVGQAWQLIGLGLEPKGRGWKTLRAQLVPSPQASPNGVWESTF